MTQTFFNVPEQDTSPLPFPDRHDPSSGIDFYHLRRHLFYLWTYLIQQDIWEEAVDFIEDHWDEPTPFDLFPFEISRRT